MNVIHTKNSIASTSAGDRVEEEPGRVQVGERRSLEGHEVRSLNADHTVQVQFLSQRMRDSGGFERSSFVTCSLVLVKLNAFM